MEGTNVTGNMARKEEDTNSDGALPKGGLKTYLDRLAAVAQGHMHREVQSGGGTNDARIGTRQQEIRSADVSESVAKVYIANLTGLQLDKGQDKALARANVVKAL